MIKKLDVKTFKDKVIVKREDCLIKFYSDLCPLCIAFAPVYEEIAKENGHKLSFYKVDVDKEKDLTKIMNFEGVPTLFLFHNGRYHEVPYPFDNPHQSTGYHKQDIIDFINQKVK